MDRNDSTVNTIYIPTLAKNFVWDKNFHIKEQKELTLLTAAIYLEARGEPLVGKLAVGYVIINRYKYKRRWPNSIRGVLLQHKQFSCFNDFEVYKKAFDPPPKVWEECFDAAFRVYAEIADDPTHGADHYFNPDLSDPDWAHGAYWDKIGNHVFLRPRKY